MLEKPRVATTATGRPVCGHVSLPCRTRRTPQLPAGGEGPRTHPGKANSGGGLGEATHSVQARGGRAGVGFLSAPRTEGHGQGSA